MLEDRDYMRAPPSVPSYAPRWPWSLTTMLLVANVAVFFIQAIVERGSEAVAFDDCFALSFQGLRSGFLWQPITFQFLHAGLWHLLGNLVVIYFIGRPVEETIGKMGFLKLYFGSGVFGGLMQVAASALFPHHFGVGGVVGASAGAFGLVAAFATLYPERPLTLLLFFIPVTVKAKFLLVLEVLLAIGGLIAALDNVAHLAHLGGIVVGLVMVRWSTKPAWLGPFSRQSRSIPRPRELAQVSRYREARFTPQPSSVDDLPPGEFISREVDPILDKISAQGIHSLTPRERKILEAATARFDRH